MKTEHIRTLREAGLRITPQRLCVYDVLQSARDHPDAQGIQRMANELSGTVVALSSVYRILSEFEKHELITRRDFGDSIARYETRATGHHCHFVERDTGNITEFESANITKRAQDIARKAGFELVDYSLNVFVEPKQ
ncbi:MAG: Fur family transcriptional regulator [Pseudomonadota bacterium]